MKFFKNFRKRSGQALMEYVIVLLVISAASAAINTTYGSSEDLIRRLAHNIRGHNITSEATYVPPNAVQSITWGVTPLDGSPLISDDTSTKIETNPDSINDMPAWSENDPVKGKHLPVAYFMANQPSTYDILTVYDYSYDLDEVDGGQLKRFWKIEKTGKLIDEDASFDNSSLKCELVQNCDKEPVKSSIWDNKGSSGVYTGWTSSQMGGKSDFANATPRDKEILAEGFCYGTAQQCLPRHLANGYYTISLIVIDQDQNETAVYQQKITIRSEGYKYAYVYEYGDPVVVSREEIKTNEPEEIKLVDHQYGTVTDLYGVKHPVIEMNMLRSSKTKWYNVTTRQEVCVVIAVIETDTGKTLYTYPASTQNCETIESTTKVEETGNAGETSDNDDEGNLWREEKMQKNTWTFYVYDKRSLFNKRFIGKPSGTTLDKLKTVTDKDGVETTKASGGETYITNGNSFDDSIYNSLRGMDTVRDSKDEVMWSTPTNYKHPDSKATAALSTLTSLTEKTGSTTQLHIDIDNPNYPSADRNSAATNSDNGVRGYNNTGYTKDSVSNNKEAAATGFDFEKHETHPAMDSVVYARKCIVGCNNMAFAALDDDDLPAVDIVQVQSNYMLTDTSSNSNTGSGTTTKIEEIWEPFSDTIYRDDDKDFSDGSRMYQLRTDTKGVSQPTENDYTPDFISVRLSLNDYYGYNPGANLDTAKLNNSAVSQDVKNYYLSTPNINDNNHIPYVITNRDFNDDGVGCNECTEPNFNTDGKMQWTEYREVEGTVTPSETYYHSSCEEDVDYPTATYSIEMDARTRQYNFVEHAAFDWVYEYSGTGDGSARKATDGTTGNRTLKIRRAHWHTMGRKLDQITMGRYTDPYTVATRNNNPYATAPTSSNFSTATKDIRFLEENNRGEGKSIVTGSDTQTIGDVGHTDSSGRSDFWRVLKGSASYEESSGKMYLCTYDYDCDCGSKWKDYYVTTYTTIKLSYTGLDEEVVTYSTRAVKSSSTHGKCEKCEE